MRFSIIIPAYSRSERLRECLAGLAALDYPRDEFEVIVVDDGSAESLETVVRPFDNQLNLTFLRQDNSGPGPARNFGAEHARGHLLAFLDDDCVPRQDWLRQMEAAATRWPGAMLGGATTNGCSENIFAETNQFLVQAVSSWLRVHGPLGFCPSNNLCIPAAAFREIGGFSSQIEIAGGEDRELCARWLALGRHMVEISDARIDHYHPQTPWSFVRMHFRYGRGAALLHRLRKTSPAQFVAKGLYWSLLRGVFHGRTPSSGAIMLVLLALTQASVAAGYFFETVRRTGSVIVWLSYLAVALTLQITLTSNLSGPDEASHFMNGLLVRDYLAQGLPGSPLAYAREYYLHYPKIAIGHWPPLFAITLGIWLLLAEPGPAAALSLIAALMAVIAAFVYRAVRLAGVEGWIAWLVGLLALTLPVGRLGLAEVMIEPLCAALMFWCAVLYARYIDSDSRQTATRFGIWAAVALLVKPNAGALALLPPLCVLLGRRWLLLTKASFWLPIPIVLALAGPWYAWSWRWLESERVPGQSSSYVHTAIFVFLNTMWLGGPLVLAMVGLGVAGWFAMRAKTGSQSLAFGSLAFAVLLFHTILSPHLESRHYLLGLVPILAGLGWFLGRVPRAAAALLLIALFISIGKPVMLQKLDTGMIPVSEFLSVHRAGHDNVWLVSSDSSGEGALITAVAQRESRPSSYVLRASKMFADATWMGLNYRPIFRSADELAAALRRWPLRAVVVDASPRTFAPHHRLLRDALVAHPEDWEITLQTQAATVWTRRKGLFPEDRSDFRRELAERLRVVWP